MYRKFTIVHGTHVNRNIWKPIDLNDNRYSDIRSAPDRQPSHFIKQHRVTCFWDKTYHLISMGRLLKVGFDRVACREPLGLESFDSELRAELLGAERPQGRTIGIGKIALCTAEVSSP